MKMDILNLENWKELTRGFYRFVTAAYVCYEIHLMYWDRSEDIKQANASLYVVGLWSDDTGRRFFERELLQNSSLSDCLSAAKKDMEANEEVETNESN